MGNPARDETRMTGGSAREPVMIHRRRRVRWPAINAGMEKESGHARANERNFARGMLHSHVDRRHWKRRIRSNRRVGGERVKRVMKNTEPHIHAGTKRERRLSSGYVET